MMVSFRHPVSRFQRHIWQQPNPLMDSLVLLFYRLISTPNAKVLSSLVPSSSPSPSSLPSTLTCPAGPSHKPSHNTTPLGSIHVVPVNVTTTSSLNNTSSHVVKVLRSSRSPLQTVLPFSFISPPSTSGSPKEVEDIIVSSHKSLFSHAPRLG